MIAPWRQQSSLVNAQRPRYNRLSITFAWTTFLSIHILALISYSSAAYGYSILRASDTSYSLNLYRIGITVNYYPLIAVSFAAIAVLHAWFISEMVVLSIKYRCLTFSRGAREIPPKSSGRIKHYAGLFYVMVFTRNGIFGVEGPCFDLLLLAREVLETTLQAVQAYRMSLFLSRMWLNRIYVVLLVLNCWTVAIVHSVFHRESMPRHFVALLSDLSLDVASSIGVPLALVASYWRGVDTSATDLFGVKWFEDAWLYNASYELQLILVVSLGDLATRIVFAVGTISTLNTLKGLIHFSVASSMSTMSTRKNHSTKQRAGSTNSLVLRRLQQTNKVVQNDPMMNKLIRIGFILCGTTVLMLHIVAEFDPSSSLCLTQVRPWGITRPACHLALIDCYREGFNGSMLETYERLEPLYAPTVVMLMVRHCSAFEMPTHIQVFSNLVTIKMYNSSVENWGNDAALTTQFHPNLNIAVFIRTGFKDGLLPPGLQNLDFPVSVSIVAFVLSNIRELPDDLDRKWPSGSILHFDSTRLSSFPSVLIGLSPTSLMLGSNPIRFVPVDLFEIPELEYLDLRSTLITAIPENVSFPARNLQSMNLDGVSLSSFPAWIDTWLTFPGDPLYSDRISAAGSPYCMEREQIFSGKRATFTDKSTSALSKLTDASPSNWEYLKYGITCTPTQMYKFPLELEDYLQSAR